MTNSGSVMDLYTVYIGPWVQYSLKLICQPDSVTFEDIKPRIIISSLKWKLVTERLPLTCLHDRSKYMDC